MRVLRKSFRREALFLLLNAVSPKRGNDAMRLQLCFKRGIARMPQKGPAGGRALRPRGAAARPQKPLPAATGETLAALLKYLLLAKLTSEKHVKMFYSGVRKVWLAGCRTR